MHTVAQQSMCADTEKQKGYIAVFYIQLHEKVVKDKIQSLKDINQRNIQKRISNTYCKNIPSI